MEILEDESQLAPREILEQEENDLHYKLTKALVCILISFCEEEETEEAQAYGNWIFRIIRPRAEFEDIFDQEIAAQIWNLPWVKELQWSRKDVEDGFIPTRNSISNLSIIFISVS